MKLNMDSGIMQALAKVTDVMLLQLAFILTSLPIFTIGAGLTALFATTRKVKRDSISSTLQSYFAEFRANFKKSTVVWILFLIVGFILFVDISYYRMQEKNGLNTLMLTVAWVLVIVVYLIAVYVFPLLAWFENGIKAHLKNALLMSASHFLTTLLVTVVYAAFALMAVVIFPLFVFVGFSGAIYISGRLISKALSVHSKDLDPEPVDPED